MNNFALTNTPGGDIFVEIEEIDDESKIELVRGSKEQSSTFEKASNSLKTNAAYIKKILENLAPDAIEITCGLKFGIEGGNSIWGLAKVNTEANYSISMKWSKKD